MKQIQLFFLSSKADRNPTCFLPHQKIVQLNTPAVQESLGLLIWLSGSIPGAVGMDGEHLKKLLSPSNFRTWLQERYSWSRRSRGQQQECLETTTWGKIELKLPSYPHKKDISLHLCLPSKTNIISVLFFVLICSPSYNGFKLQQKGFRFSIQMENN